MTRFIVPASLTLLVATSTYLYSQNGQNGHETKHDPTTRSLLHVPDSLQTEHAHIHHMLGEVMQLGGQTGEAASQLHAVLQPHFEEEEKYAMPPIGLLKPLAEQSATKEQMHAALEMSNQLKENYDEMLAEHKKIHRALDKLAEMGRKENKPSAVEFAETLALHAQTEEQVLYPATIVIGDYIRLKMAD